MNVGVFAPSFDKPVPCNVMLSGLKVFYLLPAELAIHEKGEIVNEIVNIVVSGVGAITEL